MNYTGGPSISGCRPVLPLYPTHYFCQYLLRIFITFTNSSLFCRAFSTNSRSPLRHAAGVTAPPEGEELNLSVTANAVPLPGCALSGASRQLPQRGSLWQAPQSERFRQRLPYQGSCLRSRLRGCTKTEPDREPLLDSTSPSALTRCHLPYRGEALAFPVSFWRNVWYNGFAALPAHFMGREVKPNGVYFYLYPVRRSECSVLLHLQVA